MQYSSHGTALLRRESEALSLTLNLDEIVNAAAPVLFGSGIR
jgi:hypothetical protein